MIIGKDQRQHGPWINGLRPMSPSSFAITTITPAAGDSCILLGFLKLLTIMSIEYDQHPSDNHDRHSGHHRRNHHPYCVQQIIFEKTRANMNLSLLTLLCTDKEDFEL